MWVGYVSVWSVYRVEPTALLSYMKNIILKYTVASTGKIKSWSYTKLFKYINISLTVTDAQYWFFTSEKDQMDTDKKLRYCVHGSAPCINFFFSMTKYFSLLSESLREAFQQRSVVPVLRWQQLELFIVVVHCIILINTKGQKRALAYSLLLPPTQCCYS